MYAHRIHYSNGSSVWMYKMLSNLSIINCLKSICISSSALPLSFALYSPITLHFRSDYASSTHSIDFGLPCECVYPIQLEMREKKKRRNTLCYLVLVQFLMIFLFQDESMSIGHTYFRYESLLASFIFDAIDLAIIALILIPAHTACTFL